MNVAYNRYILIKIILNTMEILQLAQNATLTNLQALIKYAEENNLTNSLEFLDFLDKINELSVRY